MTNKHTITDDQWKTWDIVQWTWEMWWLLGIKEEQKEPTKDEIIEELNRRIEQEKREKVFYCEKYWAKREVACKLATKADNYQIAFWTVFTLLVIFSLLYFL